MEVIPSQSLFHEIPCIVQSEEQWIRELKSRFTSLEEVAFQCSYGNIQTVQDLLEQQIPMYKVFLECMKCGIESHESENGRLIYRNNESMFVVFDFAEEKRGKE